jgi:beta-phosphoglucomutase-like phosphatase (HAD superfamily)
MEHMQQMIRAVLFDMDGVLVDSEPAHLEVTCEALRHFGLPLPDDEAWEAVFFGRPDRDGLAEWFLLHHVAADIEAVMADKLTRFEARFADLVTAFDDGQWLARELHRHGLPLALVTGARRDEANLVLSRFDLCDVFAASISSDESITGKPDPIPYLMGADALSVTANECVVIEDAIPGLRAAEAAGATPIVVDRLDRPERFETLTPVTALDEQVLSTILDLAGLARR